MRKFTSLRTWYVLISAFSLLVCAPLFAQNQDAGTTGFATLKNLYSARGNAMGQAMTGRVMNFDGIQSNPASIMRLPNRAISSTFMDHFVGSGGGSLQYLVPKNIYTSYGMFLNYWNSGSIDRTDISPSGELIDMNESFGAQNVTAGFTYAKFLTPAIDAGATIKFLWDQIDDSSASAAMVDIGIMHHTANERIKVGVAAKNLGKQITHYSDSKYVENMPTTYAVGMGIDLSKATALDIDLGKAKGENFVAKLGVEHMLNNAFTLRGGFRSNAKDYYNGGAMAWTSGISLGLGWAWKSYAIDYALASYGDLGITNQISLRYNLKTGFLPARD
jgi:hypothetical protein